MDSIVPTAAFAPGLDHRTDGDDAVALPKVGAAAKAAPSPGRLVAAAAATGVAAAAIVGLALHFLLPPQRAEDPRVPVLTRDVEEVKQQLLTITDKLRALETGAVSSAETLQELSSTVREQTAALASVNKALSVQADAVRQRWEDQNRIATPALMGVAVVQLRNALDRGRRFDWELVNLWGIAGQTPAVAAELASLAPYVRGVPSEEQIKARLQVLASRWDYGLSLIRTGLSATEWLVGLGSAASYTPTSDAALLSRTIALIERGDYTAAGRELQKVDAEHASEIAPIVIDIRNRVVALSACGRLMVLAKKALEAQGQGVR